MRDSEHSFEPLEKAEQKPRPRGRRAGKDGTGRATGSMLDLQRSIGNQGILQLLRSGSIQAKLRVSQPGDTEELEADGEAERVMSEPCTEAPGSTTAPVRSTGAASGTTLHRKCECRGGAKCPECEADELERSKGIHRKSSSNHADVAAAPDDFLKDLGAGRALDSSVRKAMEPQFGQDFSAVRIHDDSRGAESARSINARAFTLGRDIVFGSGEYAPQTGSGKKLLAHELTHVVQQKKTASQGRVQRVGILEGLARLFGGGTFSDEELKKYLDFLDKNDHIEDHFDSDNKAREVVRRWQRGDAAFILTLRRKELLILEMLSGYTSNADELGILALLSGSGSSEFDHLVGAVGEEKLRSKFSGKNRKSLDGMLASSRRKSAPGARGARPGGPPPAQDKHTFDPQTVLEAQRLFNSNAAMGHTVRRNCIEIVRAMAPQLFAQDPVLAEKVRRSLGKLKGANLTMPDAGRVLAELGLAAGPVNVRFNNGDGNNEPTAMVSSAWDTIIGMTGKAEGWQVFGLAVFDGYHSVTVFVDHRPDGPRVYWADQWAIDPGEETAFHQEAGSISGFRRYEKAGFDKFIEEKTREWWNEVHSPDSKCGRAHPKTWDRSCRYTATLKIWQLQSGI